jgi:hypothetical protein
MAEGALLALAVMGFLGARVDGRGGQCVRGRGRTSVVRRNGKKCESVGVLVVSSSRAVREEHNGSRHQDQTDEHLQVQDLHKGLLSERVTVVSRTTLTEASGMTMAHTSGDKSPAQARPTLTML